MNPGRLSRQITLQQLSSVQDAVGQPITTWSDIATLWADIKTLGGLEAIKAGANTSSVRSSIRIRWRTGITPAMRAKCGDTLYEIKAILPDEQGRRHIDLVCETLT